MITADSIRQYALSQQQQRQPAPQQKPQGNPLLDWLPTIGGVAGGVLGLPFGGVGAIGGSAAGSGLGDALKQLLGGKQYDVGETAKETGLGALGGLGGIVGGKVLGGAARLLGGGAADTAGEVAGRAAADTAGEGGLGATLRKGVLNPKAPVGATQAGKEAELAAAQEGFGLKGGPEAQKVQVNHLYSGLQDELQTLASNSKKTVPFTTLKDLIKKDVTQSGTYFIPNEKPYENALRAELSLLEKDTSGGASLQSLLSSKDKLAAGIKNFENPVSVREQVKKDIWTVIDDSITKIEPEAKALTGSQSMLHKIEPGLAERVKQGVNAPIVGKVPGAIAEPIMAAQDALGRGVQGLSGIASKLPAGTTSQAVGQGAARSLFSPAAPATVPAELSNNPTQGNTPTGLSGMNFGQDQSSQNPYPIENFVADARRDPKNAALYKQLYDEYQKQEKQQNSPLDTASQARHDNLQTALSSLDAAEQNLITAGGAKGPLVGGASTIPVLGQLIDAPGASYHSTKIELATQLAKAITGGSRPAANVIQAYLHSLPDVNDQPEFAQAKINKIRSELLTQARSFKFNDLGQQ